MDVCVKSCSSGNLNHGQSLLPGVRAVWVKLQFADHPGQFLETHGYHKSLHGNNGKDAINTPKRHLI